MFIYFLPTEKSKLSAQDLRDAGLAHILDGDAFGFQAGCKTGPEKLAGVIVGQKGKHLPGYKPDQQIWRKGPKGVYWVGLWKDEKPTAEQLARGALIEGEGVKLRDGGTWMVPRARSFVRGSALPQELCIGDDGETWEMEELPEFIGVCQDAERVLEVFFKPYGEADESGSKPPVSIEYKEGIEIAVRALGVNYRVGALELSMLKALGTAEMWAILSALIDLNAYVDMKKKEEASADTPSTASGETDDLEVTSQPSPT